MVYRVRGISNLAGSSQSASTISRIAASTSSSAFFANATLASIPALPEYLFVPNPMALAAVTFAGSVIAGDSRGSFLHSSKLEDPIAGSEKNPQFEDKELINFFKTQEGKNHINIQNVRRPVHILADFDYATLNRSLDPVADPDEESRNQMSGAARIWARNENAKEWKEWVASCFFTELALGTPVENESFRETNNDFSVTTLKGDSESLRAVTDNAFRNLEGSHAIRNLVNGYYGIYLAESFVFDVFKSNPFRSEGDNDVVRLTKQIDSLRTLLNTTDNFNEFESEVLDEQLQTIKDSFLLKRSGDSLTLPKKITFGGESKNRNDDVCFQLQYPGDEQGFIKSSIEVTRAIGGYLKDEKFYYRHLDKNNPDWVNQQSFNEYYDKIRVQSILPKSDFFNPGKNVYEKAFRIRKIILKSVYLKKNSSKLAYLKDLKAEAGKPVIDVNKDLRDQDDIEKALCKTLSISDNDYITISPYLTDDYMTTSSTNEFNNFLTLKDSFDYKKSKLLNLLDAFSENNESDARRISRDLKKFTFDHGPKQLIGLMEQLEHQFCPIGENSSLQEKNALVLLDHNNIVAHLTHGKVGQFIMDATLEKINLVHHRNEPNDLSYEIKITSPNSNANQAYYDLFDGNRSGRLINSSIESRDENIGETTVRTAFTSDSSTVSLEFSRLLNSTFIKSLSPERRKEYIFFNILLQLSSLESNPTESTPYFLGLEENATNNFIKLPGIADVLYSEYFNRLSDQSFRVPGNKVSDFFSDAGVASGATQAFSSISSLNKATVNNFLLKRMLEECLSKDSGGPLGEAFDDIVSLQDRISHIPSVMDFVANSYRELVLDIADRLTPRTTDSAAGQLGNFRRQALANLFQNAPANRPDSWSLVLQDFVSNGANDFQGNNLDSEVSNSVNSDISFINGVPDFTTNASGEVVGISGFVANKQAGIRSGFSTANIRDEDGINDDFKASVLSGIKDKVLKFDRETNILINLAENICSILFYGFPPDAQNKMFEQEFNSSFHINDSGILSSIGLLSEEGNLEMTGQEIFDVVWGYCTIADQLMNHIPGVKMKFDFKNSTFRPNQDLVSDEDEVYREADDVYNLQPALDSLGDVAGAIATLRTRANRYLPPDVMNKIPTSRNKGQVGGRDYQQQSFGANFGDNIEAGRRKRELTDDFYDLAARAAVFFKQADKEIGKEPQFSLVFKREDEESNNPFKMLAKGTRLGFLPHLAIDSDFARNTLVHMESNSTGAEGIRTNLGAGTVVPSFYTQQTVNRLVGLRPVGEKYQTASGREVTDSFNKLKFSMIKATDTHPNRIIPSILDRVSYSEGINTRESGARGSGRYGSGLRTSMLAYPQSCFGFVHSLNSDIEVSYEYSQYAVSENVSNTRKNKGINQFNSENSSEIIEELSLSTEDSLAQLNDLYSTKLALTPPRIYQKMVEKIPRMHEFIGGVKSVEDTSIFNEVVQNLGSLDLGEFKVIPIRPPVHRKRKKFTVEITIVKESYQFVKALKATPQRALGWDGQVTEPIQAVIPCNATYSNPRYPSDFYDELIDVLSTFFVGSAFTPRSVHDDRLARGEPSLYLSPYYDYRQDGSVGILNDFGNYMNNNVHGPLIPLGSAGNINDYEAETFGWQFDLFCNIMSKFYMHSGDPNTNEHRVTKSHPPPPNAVPHGTGLEHIKDMLAAYVYNGENSGRYRLDIKDWLNNWSEPEDFDWSHYFYFISPSSTNPNPWFIRSDHAHYPTEGLPTSYYTSTWPNEPRKAILGSNWDGAAYVDLGSRYSGQTKINSDLRSFSTSRPEFRSANRTGLKTRSQKIKVEIYLVKGRDGNYTHYSTEPVFDDELDHPSLRPIDNLYDGRGFDSREPIILRPSSVAEVQYTFGGVAPQYLGPFVPGDEPPSPDNYFVNESLPFIAVYDWGTQLANALRSTSLEEWENIDETNNPKTTTYRVSTSEFTGISEEDMDRFLRDKANEQFEAQQPRALTFLNKFRFAVDNYIRQRPGLSEDQKGWLRTITGKFPYFYDWKVQFPSLEVDIQLDVENFVEEGDIYLDLNWRAIRDHDLQDDSSSRNSFNELTKKDKIENIYSLEKNYLDFVFSIKEYATKCSNAFESGMSIFSKSVEAFTNDPGGSDNNNFEIIKEPSNRNYLAGRTFLGQAKSKNIVGEVRKFVKNNGFLSVTPDTLASLDSLKNLYSEQYFSTENDFRHKSKGIQIQKGYRVQVPFKICPYDIRIPYQLRGRDGFASQENPTKHWQQMERNFSIVDHYGKAALDSNDTRVCFVGIESGELQKIIDSPLSNYGSYSEESRNLRNRRDRFGSTQDSIKKFQVKLELFDFFNPWLQFEYAEVIEFSREKPYRILSPHDEEPTLTRNHKNSAIIRNIFSQQQFNRVVNAGNTGVEYVNFSGGAAGNKYDLLDVFLKAYSSKVLGLDFFSFMIPKRGTTPPVADFVYDNVNSEGMLPEERNYQEYLNEYTQAVFHLIEEAEGANFGDVRHLIKYFFDRHVGNEEGDLASASSIAGSNLNVRHYDEYGRSTLVSGESGFGGLFTSDVIDKSDPESPKFFPYKFSKPITETSLAAAEILTSINEYSPNFLREFRHGFAFDRIVGIPYKMKNFKISKFIRRELSGKPVDLSGLDQRDYNLQTGELTDDYFEKLKSRLIYLDKDSQDGIFVASNVLYPLSLRAKVCKIEDS